MQRKTFFWTFCVVKSLKLWPFVLEISFISAEKPFVLTNLDYGIRSLKLYWTFLLLLATSLCWWCSKLCEFIKNAQQNTKVECKRNCNAIELSKIEHMYLLCVCYIVVPKQVDRCASRILYVHEMHAMCNSNVREVQLLRSEWEFFVVRV